LFVLPTKATTFNTSSCSIFSASYSKRRQKVDNGNALKLKLNIRERELPTLLACDRVISVISTDHKKMNSRWWQFGEAARSDHPSHDDPQMTTLLLFPVSLTCHKSRLDSFNVHLPPLDLLPIVAKVSFYTLEWMMPLVEK
jgi:hypothetical protein